MASTASRPLIPSHFNPSRTQNAFTPAFSSPLAAAQSSGSEGLPSSSRPAVPQRAPSFPASRPLRPFPSIAASIQTRTTSKSGSTLMTSPGRPKSGGARPVKLIEPSKHFNGGFFVLNLTQAEFSRQQ
ncbi:hypothetical protein SISSUDRAFT_511779 [Sistotremastrum suecicum HHB10207 ss-3]|uniref:Uncharacterized protein n=1 Tax=Sistotremastrum suecicum HHB10207 ss-3 TaxID=1314776 RepID=A0A166INT6_9AGAM|nr:hypothetical protein SISSUDRAFT_511779 [Sistotremastrum suecicum HHB10207 ss-3]